MRHAYVCSVAVLVAACHSDATAGRVELANEGGMLVLRDSMHVLEVSLASTRGLTFENVELSEIKLPGRVAMFDEAHGYLLLVWITRLGDKRPENIQRWFDDKLATIRGASKILSDHGSMLPGNHPARTTDFLVKSRGHDGYERLLGVDVPEHDLDVIVSAVVLDPQPNATQLAWLDAVAADVHTIHIAAPRH